MRLSYLQFSKIILSLAFCETINVNISTMCFKYLDRSSRMLRSAIAFYLFLTLCDCNADKSAIICEFNSQQLTCETGDVIQIKSANYGRTNGTTCPNRYASNRNCFAHTSKINVANTCNNKKSCTVVANNNVFGDPCPGTYKYLHVEYECIKPQPCKDDQFQCNDGTCVPGTAIWDGIRDCSSGEDEAGADYESDYICESNTATIKCGRGEVLSIINANYGRLTTKICSNEYMANTNCKASYSLNIIKDRCNLKDSCTIQSTNSVFGDPCGGTFKYTEVHYQCIKLPGCTENEFQCRSGHCIEKSRKCDGHWDCTSGEDELGCDYFTEFSCENSVLNLDCKIGDTIKIVGASYGRRLAYMCTPQPKVDCSSVGAKAKMQARCDGHRKCSISATNAEFGDPCVGTIKYLTAYYKCVGSNNILSEPIIE